MCILNMKSDLCTFNITVQIMKCGLFNGKIQFPTIQEKAHIFVIIHCNVKFPVFGGRIILLLHKTFSPWFMGERVVKVHEIKESSV